MEKDITIGAILVLLLFTGLLYKQYRNKQQTNQVITKKGKEIVHKNEVINQKNKNLELLLQEKEWLIKEVHHRVKNNLQTIISLLQSQAAYLQNDALKAIETSQNRIYTMSLIHQKLYQSEDIQTIDMAIYIPELIQYLKDSFDNSNNIDFNVKVVQVNLDASIAIPVALIINEALTNSIKYAFPGGVAGGISVSLQEQGESLKLELTDNGIGMKKKSIQDNHVSLGLPLIKGLAKEIHGKVSFKNNHGVKITLVFKRHALEYANLVEIDRINLA
jgi:two-component sensor histidine kinase